MINTLMIFQAIVSVLLILMVLLQFGKGAEAGLMGGSASDAVFTGSQQGNILSKITVVLSILFLGNSILLAKLQSERSGTSLMDNEAPVSRPLNSDPKLPTNTTTQPTDTKAAAPAKADAKKDGAAGTKTE